MIDPRALSHIVVLLLAATTVAAQQKLELASPFVDGAILQREMQVPVWGWSTPGTSVTVQFAGQEKTASVGRDGRWKVELDPLSASADGATLTVRDGNGGAITRAAVLVGEVWLASGQSNMDWIASRSMCRDLAHRLQRSKEDEPVREYNVDIGSSLFPRSRAHCKDGWKRSGSAGGFSALALAFAWELHQELQVPIGILRATHGATNVETWTPFEGFADHPKLQHIAERIRQSDPSTAAGKAAYEKFYGDLKDWQTASEARMARGGTALPRPRLPGIAEDWKGASRMFNKKIAPLIPYAIRGAIWCQGTHNAGDGRIYAAKMEALVQGWRKVWGRPDLPFHFVQAPCYGKPDPDAVGFADLREAQRLFFGNAKNVGMALQYDLNPARPTGVHYYNKLDPGKRLARWALVHQYGRDLAYSGPVYESHRIDGNVVRVKFAQPGRGNGLMVASKGMEADAKKNPGAYVEPARETKGAKLAHFRLAGKDGVWHAAEARIDEQEVVVTATAVPDPVGVQYAHSASPIGANLYNRAGLPATPFAYFEGRQLFQEDVVKPGGAKPRRRRGRTGPYVQLATIFRPGAVLQRDMPIPVWGFAQAGTKLTVQFAGQTKTAVAGEFEHWRVDLEPVAASTKGRTLKVSCSDGASASVRDVVVGDVWVLTGSTQVSGETFRGELPEELPLVREFKIRTNARRFREPRKRRMEIGGGKYESFWKAVTAAPPRFDTSVAGYHFAKEVHAPGVPLGIITLGADNPPLTWISYDGLQTATGFEKERDELNLLYPNTDSGKAAVRSYIATLRSHNEKVATALRTGGEFPDELAESAPAFPQPAYDQWARYVENATLTYNFCISPLTPMAVRGVAWLPGPRNVGADVKRYTPALEAWARSISKTFEVERLPFLVAQPSETLVPGIGALAAEELAISFDEWPKSVADLARRLGALAKASPDTRTATGDPRAPARRDKEQSTRPPNVVFIMADDLGYGDLGCYGATHFATPACDRLAREGMRFTDAHSPSAVCTPTRYSVLTGRYCWRTWLKNWVLFAEHPLLIEADRVTMGHLFQQKGYATGCIGKWHLGWGTDMNPDFSGETKPGPLEVGFDSFYGVPFSHNSPKALQVYVRDRRIVNLPAGAAYDSPAAMKKTVRKLQDTAIQISKEAVAFVEKHRERPFFLYYPTTNIHFPLTPNRRFKGSTRSGVYGEFVVEFDWAVGELLQTLDRFDLTNDTIVVVTSDNGARPHRSLNGHQCNGPWRGTKRQIYEGGHRIPLIVRWPGKVRAGAVTDETVCLTDFFRTFASILGAKVPTDAGEDSYDISAVLRGEAYEKPLREATVHHSVSGRFAIRQGDWKLIEGRDNGDYPRDGKGRMAVKSRVPKRDADSGRIVALDYFELPPATGMQLYNLRQDPTEQKDSSGEYPGRVAAMRKLLDRYRTSGRSR